MGTLNPLILISGSLFLLIGGAFIYKPSWILKMNQMFRDIVFNDAHILLERRKKGFFFLLVSFIFFYWGYHRAQYTQTLFSETLVSTDRLLYQSLNHLHSREYAEARELCKSVLRREPRNGDALYQLAAAEFLSGNHPAGASLWAQARRIDPDHASAPHLRDWIFRVSGMNIEAGPKK